MHGHRKDPALVEKYQKDPLDTRVNVLLPTMRTLKKLATYLLQRDDVDPDRLCIGGYSMGGYHAGAAMLTDMRIKAAFISISYPDLFGPARYTKPMPADMSRSDKSKLRTLQRYSLIDNPEKLAARPLLVINGKTDPVFPYHTVQTAVADLRKSVYHGPDRHRLKLVGIPNCAHHVTLGMERQCIDWLKRWV